MAANNFDFDSYNALVKKAPVGLKLHLGVQMIRDVVSSLEFYDNPLEAELRPILVDLKEFHTMYKEHAKAASEKKANPSERNAQIDNSTVLTPDTVQNMMAMMVEFQRMMAAQKAGNDIAAMNAQKGITEIQNGELNAKDEGPQQKAA